MVDCHLKHEINIIFSCFCISVQFYQLPHLSHCPVNTCIWCQVSETHFSHSVLVIRSSSQLLFSLLILNPHQFCIFDRN